MVNIDINRKAPFFHKRKVMEISHGPGNKTREDTGKTDTGYRWTDRLPHPMHMYDYELWGNDAEASVALEVLKNIIAGVGYYTEMPEEFQPKTEDDPPHRHQLQIDEYGEQVNLDEKLQYIVYSMLHKGFCPVEVIDDFDLKILPAETFYIYMTKKGDLIKYTQERSENQIITEWKSQEEKDTILLFYFGWTPNRPYGKSLLEPIGDLITERAQMNLDMPAAIHRWAYPIPIMETSGSKDSLQDVCEGRDIDEWIFIGNANEGDVRWKTLAIDPQARFIPYIELIYYQICEGLHAPLLLYLKNATEASATVMMESVDRLVNGVQRYVKRRVEKHLFKPQVGDPVPRLVWGQPKTGLEEVTLQDISAVLPYMAKNQQQHLLKQYLGGMPDPEWEEPAMPQLPFQQQPFQKKSPEIPISAMLEKLNDLQTSLNIIEANHKASKLTLIESCRLADRTITVHMKRVYPDSWQKHRDEEFQRFIHEKLAPKLAGRKTYTVAVD